MVFVLCWSHSCGYYEEYLKHTYVLKHAQIVVAPISLLPWQAPVGRACYPGRSANTTEPVRGAWANLLWEGQWKSEHLVCIRMPTHASSLQLWMISGVAFWSSASKAWSPIFGNAIAGIWKLCSLYMKAIFLSLSLSKAYGKINLLFSKVPQGSFLHLLIWTDVATSLKSTSVW